MSLSAAMNAAVSGLAASGRGLQVVSDNVANALTEGYATRELGLQSSEYGGVRSSGIQRLADPALIASRRSADTGEAVAGELATFASSVERLFGSVDDPGSIAGTLNRFQADLLTAASTPESDIRLTEAARSAKDLVGAINRGADGISDLRQRADRSVALDVDALNTDLLRVEKLNRQITQALVSGRDFSALEDLRQQTIDRINTIVPVRLMSRENGQVALISETGGMLLDGKAAHVGFTPTPFIAPDSTLANGDLSGLTLNGEPIPSGPRGPLDGGRLGASLAIRDDLGPAAQSRLDSYARDLLERFEPASAATGAGLFRDVAGPFDPADEMGLASRLRLDDRIDPSGAAEVWRLRDGLDAAAPGDVGDASGLSDMVGWLDARRAPSNPDLALTPVSAQGLAAALSARASADRVSAERDLSLATSSQAELKRIEQEKGVDTDAEMQNLIAFERAYAANARVLSAVDEMLKTLTRI
jgi:flagellar hook-associated protein 1 FlgK